MYLESEKEQKKMIARMKAWGKKVTATEEIARKTLVEMGIITESGKLTKQYTR
jgi:hypothetical protein